MARLDITIMPDGTGLPPGSGTVAQGAAIFAAQCASCHGDEGAGGIAAIPALTGGMGSLKGLRPVKTVNSFWPNGPLIFDYIRRAMPPTAPGTLSPGDTYALVAYILSIDGILPAGATLDAARLTGVRMPNRAGFVEATVRY